MSGIRRGSYNIAENKENISEAKENNESKENNETKQYSSPITLNSPGKLNRSQHIASDQTHNYASPFIESPVKPKTKLSSRAKSTEVVIDMPPDLTKSKKTSTEITNKILQSRGNSPLIPILSNFPSPIGRTRHVSDPVSSQNRINNIINDKLINLSNRTTAPLETVIDNRSISVWNDEVVSQFLLFSKICHESSVKCKLRSVYNKRMGLTLKITGMIFSSLVVLTSIGSLSVEIKQIMGIILGILITTVFGVVQLLNPEKVAEMTTNSSLELDRMSRSIKFEISKDPLTRVNPYDFIAKLESQREKLLKDTGIEDD